MSENQVIVSENGVVSGLDVMALSNGNKDYFVKDCDLNYKYICEETSE